MANVVYPNTLTNNTLADADEVMANFNALTAQINGNLDSTNLANLAVTTGKINDLAVTTGKIADLAVTTAKIADDAVTSDKVNLTVSETQLGTDYTFSGTGYETVLTSASVSAGTWIAFANMSLKGITAAKKTDCLMRLSYTGAPTGALAAATVEGPGSDAISRNQISLIDTFTLAGAGTVSVQIAADNETTVIGATGLVYSQLVMVRVS